MGPTSAADDTDEDDAEDEEEGSACGSDIRRRSWGLEPPKGCRAILLPSVVLRSAADVACPPPRLHGYYAKLPWIAHLALRSTLFPYKRSGSEPGFQPAVVRFEPRSFLHSFTENPKLGSLMGMRRVITHRVLLRSRGGFHSMFHVYAWANLECLILFFFFF